VYFDFAQPDSFAKKMIILCTLGQQRDRKILILTVNEKGN